MTCTVCNLDSSLTNLNFHAIHTKTGPIHLDEICYENYRYSTVFSCCGGKGTATWDQTNQKWKCADCGATQSTDPSYIGGGFIPKTDQYESKPIKKCECGAETAKTTHSSIMPCPLYVKP